MVTNPFNFGPIAIDDAFTDRAAEVAELKRDAQNGQDVVIFAPRRYGKTSLVRRVSQELVSGRALVAEVNLMFTPTKEKLAGKLAEAIAEHMAGPVGKLKDRLGLFAGLRVTPTMSVDPNTGAFGFSFSAGHSGADIDDTLERLFSLPAQLAADRRRRAVLIIDEFQEITAIDPGLPKLLRSVFQEQPDVAHIYLGSKRHMMEQIFNDENEPFWRSAKRTELGVIAPDQFAPFVAHAFGTTGKAIEDAVVERVLAITLGHPYATQELCYFLWEQTGSRRRVSGDDLDVALANVLRSEHSHFSGLWDKATANQRLLLQALAAEPGRPLSEAYRSRHNLKPASTTQKAIDGLVLAEVVEKTAGFVRISEPFYAEWLVAYGT
jgi:hypothetical protein